jgi:hypothetical protein
MTMPGKPFTHYLVALATDAEERSRFLAGGDAARASMASAGLTDTGLQDTLLSGDQAKIDAAVADELLPDEPAGGRGLVVHFKTQVFYIS